MAAYPAPTEDLPIFDTSVFNNTFSETTSGSTDLSNLLAGTNIVKTISGDDSIISTSTFVEFVDIITTNIEATFFKIEDQANEDISIISRNNNTLSFYGSFVSSVGPIDMSFWTGSPGSVAGPIMQIFGGTPEVFVTGDIKATGVVKGGVAMEAPTMLIGTVNVGTELTTHSTDISTINTNITNLSSQVSSELSNIATAITTNDGRINGLVTSLSLTDTNVATNTTAINTKYAFNATSTLNSNITISTGNIIPFSSVSLCVPNISDYSGNNYIVPIIGIYKFDCIIYMSSSNSTILQLGIYKNGTIIAIETLTASETSSISTLINCVVGDVIDVRCVTGTNISVFMGYPNSQFYGYKI